MQQRFIIDTSKIAPFNTIGLGDTVVFDVGDKYCRMGVIVGFENSEEGLAVIKEICSGAIVKRNLLFDFSNNKMFKVFTNQNFKEDK